MSRQTTRVIFFLFLLLVTATVEAFSPGKTPIVICPGFGNDQIDYYEPLKQPREVGLVAALERRGFDESMIFTVPVQRADWIRVAGGLLDINFYKGTALPTGNGYGWYVKQVKETVDRAYEASGGERVLLLGHSAGGWLARAAMGDGVWCSTEGIRTSERIRCLTTVGAIHRPPRDSGSCVTRGALANTDKMYPGAFLADEGIGYVSVGGDAIVGDNTKTESVTEADELYAKRGEGSAAGVAFTAYKAVCGEGDMTGDGVVPLEWTQLEGSRQIQLKGVIHSINEAGTTIPTDRWYGSENIIDQWLPATLEEAGMLTTESKSGLFDLEGIQQWASQQIKGAQELLQQSQS